MYDWISSELYAESKTRQKAGIKQRYLSKFVKEFVCASLISREKQNIVSTFTSVVMLTLSSILKYADAESAISLVQAFVPYTSFTVRIVLYNDCTKVEYLGQLRGSKLTELIQDKIKLLDVINVAAL